jgi:hypothetical protein
VDCPTGVAVAIFFIDIDCDAFGRSGVNNDIVILAAINKIVSHITSNDVIANATIDRVVATRP